jgi:RND family efflux transporter MFP subunit
MERTRIVSTGLGLLLLAAALVMALGAAEPVIERQVPSRRVRVAAVEGTSATQALPFAGTVRARERASLAFTVGGRLESRAVELGDRVRAGQVLARLDARELEHAAASARAAFAEAAARTAQLERDAEREARLFASKAATDEDLERARTAVEAMRAARDAAKARQDEAERRLTEATLRAPYAGTISEVRSEPGENLVPGQPVLVLSGEGELEIEIGVPETLLETAAVGQQVAVSLPLRGHTVQGTVRAVGRAAVGSGRLFPLTVTLPPGVDAPPGSTANVVLERGSADALAVPLAAVLNPGGQRPAVFRVAGGRAERVAVELVGLAGERVQVRGPLAVGDEVVVAGHGSLVDGDPVEVAR